MFDITLTLGLVQLIVFILVILATGTKLAFYLNIKSRKQKDIGTYIKSFRTWYRINNFHDEDNNLTRQSFMKASNIINIIWWPLITVLIVLTLMNFISLN